MYDKSGRPIECFVFKINVTALKETIKTQGGQSIQACVCVQATLVYSAPNVTT